MADHGFLIPPWYQSQRPDRVMSNIASIFWGMSISCGVFAFAKAARQTWLSWRRRRVLNVYIALVWAEWWTSASISVLSWLFLQGILPPSFWTFFAMQILWIVELQCILQIVANRLSLLFGPRSSRARKLKLAIFFVMTLITVSVSVTWIPARLQLNPTVVAVNDVWDRATKGIFAALDVALNVAFLRIFYRQLILGGLNKYWTLFRVNVAMICLGLSLDGVLIGVMSLSCRVVYMQFNPLVFMTKLIIELNLAEMIADIVCSSNPLAPRRDLEEATMVRTTPDSQTSSPISGGSRHSGVRMAPLASASSDAQLLGEREMADGDRGGITVPANHVFQAESRRRREKKNNNNNGAQGSTTTMVACQHPGCDRRYQHYSSMVRHMQINHDFKGNAKSPEEGSSTDKKKDDDSDSGKPEDDGISMLTALEAVQLAIADQERKMKK
ncbi:Uu.00g094070.m01.CDS01 [Anthostomella pinea]|uniref:Uu.00g094070.m01.CDS01 n=1 Tax=Anthostomella pinea TaxID=933095 RepID=A0AAI8YKI0_9PEZI|nr:Uu.00g094070.m01.CDS01 [Anthostomella pinea]